MIHRAPQPRGRSRGSSITPSSVADVNGAIAAIDDALHFIDHHFTKRVPTMYEHLDILGGSNL